MRKRHDIASGGGSRRSFMKKSALVAGTLLVGAGAGASSASAQEEGEEVLAFAYNFFPAADFDVIARLEQSTTVDVLQVGDETVPEISQPDEWNGHVVRYDMGMGDTAGITTFLFLRGVSLDAGDSARLADDAQMFSSDLNLLNSSIGGAAETADEGDEDDEDEADANETEGDEITVEVDTGDNETNETGG